MARKGQVVSKREFLGGKEFAKEQYEGLLVTADPRSGNLQIGVELDEDRVVVIDEATERNIRERIQSLVPQVQDIQNKYRADAASNNYQELWLGEE
ncbi:MAG TPA: hypothetical protein GXX39_07880 [Syntrophothermus lipocalidus]|nr:hypothetical protein [Syntrophothermus lipocalidus]HOV43253.1 hypothetical protein [Syntrophothermus lipocalidus]